MRKRKYGMRLKGAILAFCLCLGLALFVWSEYQGYSKVFVTLGLVKPKPAIGEKIDDLHGVAIYYNGPVGNVSGRSTAADGYNLGQKHQCVEFVKRYYYEALGHKMPNVWGHARDFFNPALPDGALNADRALRQYANGGKTRPRVGDLLVMGGGYGHVGIVSAVYENSIELAQQNPGPRGSSRKIIGLQKIAQDGETRWRVESGRTLGWLRKE